jgi:hypothetical protein
MHIFYRTCPTATTLNFPIQLFFCFLLRKLKIVAQIVNACWLFVIDNEKKNEAQKTNVGAKCMVV